VGVDAEGVTAWICGGGRGAEGIDSWLSRRLGGQKRSVREGCGTEAFLEVRKTLKMTSGTIKTKYNSRNLFIFGGKL
jgi:hypothetical protein